MRRSTQFSALRSLFRSVTAGAIVLATILSCSDSTSPTKGLDGVIHQSVTWLGPDLSPAQKDALAAVDSESLYMAVPMANLSRNLVVSGSGSAALSAPSCTSGGAFAGYEKSKLDLFRPEAAPKFAPDTVFDDKYMANMPIGFNFSFYGKTYDKVNIFSNGLLMFGTATTNADGYAKGGLIPSTALPNNVLAFAWSDWSPQLVADGIRYETRGAPGNRQYIVQFNNVPEFNSGSVFGAIKQGVGRVTVQVVLSEGSNDITIYTTAFSITNSSHKYTQGIENADGTDALYDNILNPNTGIVVPRRALFFTNISITSDALRFSLINTKDEQLPSITAPAAITQGNDPTLATAVVALGSPLASDNCGDPTISSVRSDGVLDINAPFPVGITTVTWTATDAAGNKASATQTVTVLDIEPPVFPSSISARFASQSTLTFNATSPSGALVSYNVNATDNVGVTSLVCEPASGTQFPIGNTSVKCTAGDAAGNTSTEQFNVHVASANEMLAALLATLDNLNLPNGTKQPLYNQLKNANGGELDCKKISDFIGLVGKKQSTIGSATTSLISQASAIMGALGCDGSSAPSMSAARMAN